MPEPRPGDDVEIWTGEPSRGTRIGYGIVRAILLGLFKLVGRVRVVGADKVPAHGAFVLAPVHRSNVDFALASLVTSRPMRYMGKDAIWKSRPLGAFVSMLGAFPVHRGTADRDALKACVDIVSGGSPLVMFPEGARCRGPVVEPLFDGTAYVAAKAGVPILPVGIGGSEAMMPKGARFPRPSRLVLVVGDPIGPPPPTDQGRMPRSAVAAHTEHLRGELQRLFDEAQVLAGRSNPSR